jgi:hypothetical protein
VVCQSSIILDSVGEVVFQQLIQIGLYFFARTSFNPWQIKLLALLSIEHTALHQFKTQLVILQSNLLAISLLVIADQLLLDIVLLDSLVQKVLIKLVDVLSKSDFDLIE